MNISAREAWQLLFGSFFVCNFTETRHAFRTGSIHTAKTTIFADMIAPAYFEAELGPTLMFFRYRSSDDIFCVVL
jgi:hypothetical protein